MFETERRSAISSSELGLYSDRADRYNRSKYGSIIRKFVIVVMAIVTIILAAIFIYDFAAGASASSKVSQETKHIYILQNALKKPNYLSKKITTTLTPLKLEATSIEAQERSDDDIKKLGYIDSPQDDNEDEKSRHLDIDLPEIRGQNLENFKLRKKLLRPNEVDEDDGEIETKQIVNNHAVIYRVRQVYKPKENDDEMPEESRPTPFHFEFKSPRPEAFQRPKFPQLTQYRYPQSSKNIQDIIRYLTENPAASKRGIKFTGVYVNPKKYERYSDVGEMMANSDRSEFTSGQENSPEQSNENYQYTAAPIGDPFFTYKPKQPGDVNLLAPANLRFSSSGPNRFHPFIESYYNKPIVVKPQATEQPYDNAGAYSNNNFGKKRKPKPFSVMLDIYPMTELTDQPTNNNKKISTRPRPMSSSDEYEPRRPGNYGRTGRPYAGNYPSPTQPIPVIAIPTNEPGSSDEDEKQQLIFHLNLYPRKKNKQYRNDVLQRSEESSDDDQEKFIERMMVPFEKITQQLAVHSAIEEAKSEKNDESSDPSTLALTKYEENFLEMANDKEKSKELERKIFQAASNHKADENENSKIKNLDEKIDNKDKNNSSITIDTVDEFQKYADGLIAMD